ncbi:MAG: PIN domain-containing protein [Actinomycetia bacterium]|nr:PIN domain-containing protein [Actinomycetes bacterium]
MPPERTRTYWDSCAFLSYINSVPDRLPTLDALLEESADPANEREIVTSAFTITEVAFALKEKEQKALDSQTERNIGALWSDRYAVKLIDLHEGIATVARTLIREAVADGLSLKPGDAVHLATARSLGCLDLHTYSKDLPRFSGLVGLTVTEPYTGQGRLAV